MPDLRTVAETAPRRALLTGSASFCVVAVASLVAFPLTLRLMLAISPDGPYFFAGLRALFLQFVVFGVFGAWLRGSRLVGTENAYIYWSSLIATTSLNLSIFVLGPVTLDRSLSTFLLSVMRETSEEIGLTEQELQEQVISTYVRDLRAVKRRMGEQIATGTVTVRVVQGAAPPTYSLTSKGRFVRQLFAVCGKIYAVPQTYYAAEQMAE